MLLLGGSTTKAASKTIPVQEERAKVLPKIRYEPDNKQHENDQKQSISDFKWTQGRSLSTLVANSLIH